MKGLATAPTVIPAKAEGIKEEPMKKYLGVKIIEAVPAIRKGGKVYTSNDPVPKSMEPVEDGYKVVYPDGYESWSPKDVFEEAYREISGLTFGLAIEAAKKGYGFRLPQWSPEVNIRLQVPDEHSKMTAPYLYVTSRFGCVPWNPTQIEILAEDWEVVE